METVGIVVLVLFLVFVTLALVAAVRTARAVERGVRRGSAQARRVIEDGRLRARRFTVPGPAGELVRLRLELRNSIDSTYGALEAGRGEDASLAEAAALLDRLSAQAASLDGELGLLEREPDRARITDRLPGLTERTRRICRSADNLRWAAQDRARRFADDELSALTDQIDLEAGALRHWAPVDPVRGAGAGGPAGSGAAVGPAASPGPAALRKPATTGAEDSGPRAGEPGGFGAPGTLRPPGSAGG